MTSLATDSPVLEGAGEEEVWKKGNRGGKRSVTHLSNAQLARKRANDREAQRQIRQRNKDRICRLESKIAQLEEREQCWGEKVRELQEIARQEYLTRLRLEEENKMLLLQMGQGPQQAPRRGDVVQPVQQHAVQHSVRREPQRQDNHVFSVVQDDVLIAPQKIEQDCVPDTSSGIPASTYAPAYQIFSTVITFDDPKVSQQLYTATTNPKWDRPEVFERTPQSFIKPDPASAHFELVMVQQPARYNYSPVNSTTLY